MLSYYNTVSEILENDTDTVIIPIGSIEQHSSHLPTGTDYFIAEKLSKAVAQKVNAYLLPTLPISTCYEHKGKKGSVCMRPITFYQMLQDIILNLRDQGFKRVILILTHGGIFIAGPAVRELNALYDDLQVIKVDVFSKRAMDAVESEAMHACELETSLMLYLHEELVKKDEMAKNDFVPPYPREYLNYMSLIKMSETGAWGKPSLATAEKGRQAFEYWVEDAVNYIEDAFKHTTKERW